jgi:nucleoid DNA-binding protein
MRKTEHAGYSLLIDRVWVKAGKLGRDLQRLDVVTVLELVRDEITAMTRDDAGRGRLIWPHLGTFSIRRRKARNISNPKTREVMRLAPRWQLAFRASKDQKGVVGEVPRG